MTDDMQFWMNLAGTADSPIMAVMVYILWRCIKLLHAINIRIVRVETKLGITEEAEK